MLVDHLLILYFSLTVANVLYGFYIGNDTEVNAFEYTAIMLFLYSVIGLVYIILYNIFY